MRVWRCARAHATIAIEAFGHQHRATKLQLFVSVPIDVEETRYGEHSVYRSRNFVQDIGQTNLLR